MSLREKRLKPLGALTDAEAVTNEKLEEELTKLKEPEKKVVKNKNKK